MSKIERRVRMTESTQAAVDAIPFLEDDGSSVSEAKKAAAKANQTAAKKVIEQARIEPEREIEPVVVVPLSESEAKAKAPKLYLVLADREVPSGSARKVTLKAGKVISANQFDIPMLIKQGVRLEEQTIE